MPLIHIELLDGRTSEQKRQLIREVTEAVHRTIGAPTENIRVILTEVPFDHWAVGGVTMAERRGQVTDKEDVNR
ncbi:4-oxalocrotonate tautomerase family enzyme [Sulfobacillus acidophilus TPY]|uniref:Tautomerase n=1 Tax=Sulfobacillus acidophilus (strain ATCC 700253 / DSM 10332 / NAL) TaxID=679936 RepID=G8U0B3_SULAD|nr:4-oxalocrotonate tautomerase family enzyme [Sulfobacillus acidophilus TPY]AEW06455.1 4-oxalocrotonate tautomerase family enzyme [Sulfobacillus acidophilus DSM 10332]